MDKKIMLFNKNLRKELEENYSWVGVYVLRCFYKDKDIFIPIQRLLKKDNNGVLYIGASDYIPNRVESLRISISEAYNPFPNESRLGRHTCGKKFTNKVIQELFPLNRLCVEIKATVKDEDIYSHYVLEN